MVRDALLTHPAAGALDLNAAVLVKVFVSAVAAAAVMSVAAFAALRRLGGAVIKAALYISFAFLLVSSLALMSINVIAGVCKADRAPHWAHTCERSIRVRTRLPHTFTFIRPSPRHLYAHRVLRRARLHADNREAHPVRCGAPPGAMGGLEVH